MKILAEIKGTKGCSAMVVATYSCDLAWFERAIGAPLRAAGVRQFVLLVDQRELGGTLESQRGLIGGAGRWYSLVPVQMAGAFHPKAYLLTGDERARLWIGSGNLGPCGLGRNREIFERWEVEPGDPTVPPAFSTVREYLVGLATSVIRPPAHILDVMEAALTAPALVGPPRANEEVVLTSPGELFAHLPAPGPAARLLRLTAPSFDDRGELVVRLADRLRAAAFDVIVDLRKTNLTPDAAARIQRRGGTVRITTDERPSHAKLVWAEGPGWSLGVHGSANLSMSAWYGCNAELIVLRTGLEARCIGQLIDSMATRAYDADDEKVLWLREQQAKEAASHLPEEAEPGLVIRTCFLTGASTIELHRAGSQPPVTTLGLTRNGEAEVEVAVEVVAGGDQLRALLPDECRGGVLLARLIAHDRRGPMAVVHDPRELADWANEVERGERRLMELLLTDVDDPDLAQAYVEACARVLTDRVDRAKRASDDEHLHVDHPPAPPPPDAPRWHLFRSVAPTASGGDASAAPAAMVNPVRLLARVLFGRDGHDDDDDARGEGESVEPDDPEARMIAARERPSVPSPVKIEFRRHLAAAREAYIVGLRHRVAPLDVDRLLEDLQILAIAAHRGLHTQVITASEYLDAQVPMLRAFLGDRNAPLPRALATWSDLGSERACAELLGVVGALLFQACLARAEVTGDSEEIDPRADFREVGPVLWFRHLLARIGPVSPAVLDAAAARTSRLRRLGLWLDRWPAQLARVPFRSFLARMCGDACTIAALEVRFADLLQKSRVPSADAGDVQVVGLIDGTIAIGFVEGRTGFYRHGAFQGASGSAAWEPLRESQRGVALDELFARAVADDDGAPLIDALDALDRLS